MLFRSQTLLSRPADVDPKSGITNPLPNFNLTTSPALRRRRPRKEFLFANGPLRRRHRPLVQLSLPTPTATSESPASDTPHALPTAVAFVWLGPSHTAIFLAASSLPCPPLPLTHRNIDPAVPRPLPSRDIFAQLSVAIAMIFLFDTRVLTASMLWGSMGNRRDRPLDIA